MNVKNLLIASVALLGFVSCGKSDNTGIVLPSDNIIRVSAGIGSSATRAGATAENLIEFGMEANAKDDVNYSYSDVKASKSSGIWTTSETMLWGNANNPVEFMAQAPYIKDFDFSFGNFTVQTDQSTTENIIKSDLIMARGSVYPNMVVDADSKKNGMIWYDNVSRKVNVNFRHELSNLKVKLNLGSEFNAIPYSASVNPVQSVTIIGTGTKIFMEDERADLPADIATHHLSYAAPTSAIGSGTAVYEAIVVGQTVAAKKLSVVISIGGHVYEWRNTADVTFVKNNIHTLTLNVGDGIVLAGDMIIGDWGQGGTGSVVTD